MHLMKSPIQKNLVVLALVGVVLLNIVPQLAIGLAVERMKRRIEMGEYDKLEMELDHLSEIARDTVKDPRSTVNALRNTLLDSGIEPALRNLADATGLEISAAANLERKLPDDLEACLYQIALEARNIVKKHARANNMQVTVESTSRQALLAVQDDGCGFDYKAAVGRAVSGGHIGLLNMKERAAEFGSVMEVSSTSGNGERIGFSSPCLKRHPRRPCRPCSSPTASRLPR
jgi:signal transduction histidine kinase